MNRKITKKGQLKTQEENTKVFSEKGRVRKQTLEEGGIQQP